MAKILEFRRVAPKAVETPKPRTVVEDLDDDISAIVDDYSLSPANRRWLLENMLMNMDEELQEYKLELERAERTLDALVKTAEQEIEVAYKQYIERVIEMTHSVTNVTRKKSSKRRS